MFRADLHCHTQCSDGSLTPTELILLAKQVGLQGISITDHDNIAAYTTAISAAQKEGILLGTGVEFSCDHKGQNVHVLGYGFSLTSSDIAELCSRHTIRRKERNSGILKKLSASRMPIEEDELKGTMIGRPHIAQIMVKKGYVSSIKEAFNLYIGDGKSCYVRGDAFSLKETIDAIHRGGGKAFLAHPHLYSRTALVEEILSSSSFDGLECHYSRCHPYQERRWLKLALKRQLLISGGSDFHGDIKPQIPLGCSWVDKETFDRIFTPMSNG